MYNNEGYRDEGHRDEGHRDEGHRENTNALNNMKSKIISGKRISKKDYSFPITDNDFLCKCSIGSNGDSIFPVAGIDCYYFLCIKCHDRYLEILHRNRVETTLGDISKYLGQLLTEKNGVIFHE